MNDVYSNITAGFFSGYISNKITYPLDTIKVWKQTNSYQKINLNNLYRGCFYPSVVAGVINSTLFSSNYFLYNHTQNHYISGAITGITFSFFINPVDYYKIQKQNNLDYNKTTFKNKIFRGFPLTFLRESIGTSIYFGSFNYLKKDYGTFLGGGISGTLSWISTYSIDVVKTRIQKNNNLSYIKSIRSGNLYTGIGICCLRGFLCNSITFFSFEKIKTYNII